MAKKIRRARVYQKPNDPIMRVARKARPTIARSFKQALKSLSATIDRDKILDDLRHGKTPVIDVHHYQEVLKHPLDKLATVYRQGAEVGVRKINGTFAAAGRKVRFRKQLARTVLLIRHGATALNNDDVSTDRIRGWKDIPLSPDGIEEANRLGGTLRDLNLKPDHIITSDLLRARETAEIVGGYIGVSVDESTQVLRPWNVGKLAGVTTKDALPILNDYILNRPNEPLAEGESFQQFIARLYAGLLDILQRYDGMIAIVTHHRVERVLQGWSHLSWPSDGRINVGVFDQKGEPTAHYDLIDIPIDRLVGAVAATSGIAKIEAGGLWAEWFGKLVGDRFNFNSQSESSQQRTRAAQDVFIQQLSGDVRETVDTIIADGVRSGASLSDIADNISNFVGLTDTQAQAVLNYQRMVANLDSGALARDLRNTEYDSALEDAIDANIPLSDAAISNMVSDYYDNYIDYRAMAIARTETARFANMGIQEAYSQAVERGALPEEAVKKYWLLGDAPCPICESIADNNEDGVGVNDTFDSDDGPVDFPPVHTHCECDCDYVTDLTQVPDDSEE